MVHLRPGAIRNHVGRVLERIKLRRWKGRSLVTIVSALGLGVLLLTASAVGLGRMVGLLPRAASATGAFAERAAMHDDSVNDAPVGSATLPSSQPPTVASGSEPAATPTAAVPAIVPVPMLIMQQAPNDNAPNASAAPSVSSASGDVGSGGSSSGVAVASVDLGAGIPNGGASGNGGGGGIGGGTPVVAPGAPNAVLSVLCGRNTCNVGQVCCNISCGICTEPGATCSTEPCN